MTTTPAQQDADRPIGDVLPAPGVRKHLLIAGVSLFPAGAVTLWLLPEVSSLWVVVAVVVVAHVGLLMVLGAAILRGVASRRDNG